MKTIKTFIFLSTLFCSGLSAQVINTDVEMADRLRADGKWGVVVAVIALLLFSLCIWLIRLDRKLTKLENKRND
ncbi:MAG: CcmD family protein [Bacteroidota bacterium]|jgi:uncharacterized membrane protein YdbT with pleckstrin-like domain|nr:CcmD family protein [Sphingobacteriia bacterium]